MTGDREPNWQPISSLPRIATVIDGQLQACRSQHQTLLKAAGQPYTLDDATVARVRRVFGDTADGLAIYDEQLARWNKQPLASDQRHEVERLAAQVASLHEVVDQILALGEQLKDQTIETLLAKSDLDVGVEWLLRHPES